MKRPVFLIGFIRKHDTWLLCSCKWMVVSPAYYKTKLVMGADSSRIDFKYRFAPVLVIWIVPFALIQIVHLDYSHLPRDFRCQECSFNTPGNHNSHSTTADLNSYAIGFQPKLSCLAGRSKSLSLWWLSIWQEIKLAHWVKWEPGTIRQYNWISPRTSADAAALFSFPIDRT